jgi:hypothetical protein
VVPPVGGVVEAGAVVVAGDEVVGVVVAAGAVFVVAGVIVVAPDTTPVVGVQGGVLVTEALVPLDVTPLALAPVVDVPPTWLLLSPTWLLLVPTWLLLGATCEPGVEGAGATQGLEAVPLFTFWFGVPMLLWGALLMLGDPIVMPGVPPVGVVFPVLCVCPVVPGVVAPVWLPAGGLAWAAAIPAATNEIAAKVKKRRSILLLSANFKELL